MICEMDYEEIEAITESDEAKMAWQGMVASSSLSERLQGKISTKVVWKTIQHLFSLKVFSRYVIPDSGLNKGPIF